MSVVRDYQSQFANASQGLWSSRLPTECLNGTFSTVMEAGDDKLLTSTLYRLCSQHPSHRLPVSSHITITLLPTTMDPFDQLVEEIFTRTDIYVSGAVGPQREAPIECFRPIHQAYNTPPRSAQAVLDPSEDIVDLTSQSTLHMLQKRNSGERPSVVIDRDIVTTWRLPSTMAAYEVFLWERAFHEAIGRETIYETIEAFRRCRTAGCGQ